MQTASAQVWRFPDVETVIQSVVLILLLERNNGTICIITSVDKTACSIDYFDCSEAIFIPDMFNNTGVIKHVTVNIS